MHSRQIFIVSKREEVVRFFELEARVQGFLVVSFYKAIDDASDCDLCGIDAYSIEQMPHALPKSAVLLSKTLENAPVLECERVLYSEFPMSARAFGDELWRVATNSESKAIAKEPEAFDGKKQKDKIYFYKDDPNTVGYMGRSISLTECEAKLLMRLCSSANSPISRKELNDLLGATDGNIADVYVCRLRKKLEEVGEKRIIYTVRSQGYKIITEMEWK